MIGASHTDASNELVSNLMRTAEQHASTRVPVTSRNEGVSALLARLRGNEYDSASVAAVCDGELLVGLVTMERLLSAPPDAVVATVMDADPPSVRPDTHQEHVAWAAVQHGEPGIAVVDGRGNFRGLISAQSLLPVLLEEHDEDMARLGGFLGSASSARSASTERVGRRLLHRLPWLLVGLVGALLAAVVVSAFGEQLEEDVLSRRVAVREAATGVLLGLILASLAFPLVWVGWGDVEIAESVALAMFAASAIATCVAMLLPWTLHRLGLDPAFGSGPIATVIQDLMTVSIYFLTALAIVY